MNILKSTNTVKGTTTRQRILEQGLELVSQEGFTGISIGRLAERTQLSKSGLFAHFGSLETLQLEVLRHAAELAQKDVMEPALLEAKGLPRLQKYFERLLGWAARSGLPGGCPFVSASFEFDDVEGPVREYVVEALGGMLEFFQRLILEAVAEKQLSKKVDAKYITWQILGIYTTHHTMQRLMRDPDADKVAKRAFQSLLSPYLLANSPKKSRQTKKERSRS
jgi:AcrR family transcriptional regulator